MFFGLCNSLATFQTMMNEIFQDMIHKRWIIIYMDDIFIFTKTIEENVKCIKRVLQRLADNDLYLKPEKCIFWTKEVEYLGMIISENQLWMDLVKLWGIAEWPAPTNVKNVRSFLGFGNCYHQFIHNYGNITRPLNDLLGKNKTFEWSQECQETFKLLKRKFQESLVLLMPDMTKLFVVESDTLNYVSGAVLRQQDNNGDWHPCTYLSKLFNPTKCNHEIYDRELLAIIQALTDWRYYLISSPHKVTVLSDHQNGAKTQPMTSQVESIFIRIQSPIGTCFWQTNGTIRCPIMTIRFMSWRRHRQWRPHSITRTIVYQNNWFRIAQPHSFYQQRRWTYEYKDSFTKQTIVATKFTPFWLENRRRPSILQRQMLRSQ